MIIFYNEQNKFTGFKIDVLGGFQVVGTVADNSFEIEDNSETARNIRLGFYPTIANGEVISMTKPGWMVAEEEKEAILAWAKSEKALYDSLEVKRQAVRDAQGPEAEAAALKELQLAKEGIVK